MVKQEGLLALIILDGWGVAPDAPGNAIRIAKTPFFNSLIADYPSMTLQASGEAVGLPWGEVGNSEVGHSNLGAGAVMFQSLPLINRAINSGEFAKNAALLKAIKHAQDNNSSLHLMGLLSNGGVHSSLEHLYALLDLCKTAGLPKVFIHAFLDGRDTPKNSALNFVAQLQTKLQESGVGKLATLSGRFWAMDRDNHWERIGAAYEALVNGAAENKVQSPLAALELSYQRNIFDEEFKPTVITNDQGEPLTKIQDNDAVIFFNFRADRGREMTKAFVLPSFDKFPRSRYVKNMAFVTLTEYERNLPVTVAFKPQIVKTTLSKILAEAGLSQLHIAETEKYAHVTFFFNGGVEDAYPKEDRAIIPSPAVSSYDQKPEMSAQMLTAKILTEIHAQKYNFMVINFANADMVGHTGNLAAAKTAVETLDACLAQIIPEILKINGTALVTADHGNAEEMIDLRTGEVYKEHTTNPVPFIIASKDWAKKKAQWPQVPNADLSQLQPRGILADVAPTILELMGIVVPADMTGRSLLH